MWTLPLERWRWPEGAMPQARENKVPMGSHVRDEGELCFIQEGGTAQLSRGRRPQGEWGCVV